MPAPSLRGGHFAGKRGLFVESRVGKVHVFLVHALLGQGDGLAKPLEMDDLPLPEEADDIVDIRVIG